MRIILSVVVWVVGALLTSFLFFTLCVLRVFLFPFDKNCTVLHRQCFWWADILMRMNPFWKIRITGREHVDRNATYVIVANHASLADVVLMYSLKTQFKWVAKKSLFTIPIMGWSLWIVRHISLNRGDYASIKATYKKAAEWLRKGISVVFFPEGTRSTTEDMNPFQNGAFKLAIRERKPILPVVLSGSRDAIPRGSWIFKTDINCTVEILPPIPTHTLQAGDFLRLKELTLKQFAARGKKVGVSCSEENADGL